MGAMTLRRYGAGKVSAGANVDGAPLPEDPEEGGKEEEVGEFGFNTLVCTLYPLMSFSCSLQVSLMYVSNWCDCQQVLLTPYSTKMRQTGS